jgi:hypothetical protein
MEVSFLADHPQESEKIAQVSIYSIYNVMQYIFLCMLSTVLKFYTSQSTLVKLQ